MTADNYGGFPDSVWRRAVEAAWPSRQRSRVEAIAQAIMDDRVGVPDGWRLVPEDLLTHLGDWQTACQIAPQHAAPATADSDDTSYWDHQLRTIAKIRAALNHKSS